MKVVSLFCQKSQKQNWVPMDDPQTYANSLLEGFQYQGFNLYYIEFLYVENNKVVLKTYFGELKESF